MSPRSAAYVDYQQRAAEFSVGDTVYPFMGGNPYASGRVMAVWPGIGMVDVEWPHGSERVPVEDLARYESKDTLPPETRHDNIPGGAGTVRVPGGPVKKAWVVEPAKQGPTSVRRIAEAWVKKSLYWAAKDRHYKATQGELDAGRFGCPKCRESNLRPAAYKRSEGVSERLYGCPECMFLIKGCDIIGHEGFEESDGAEPIDADWDGTMDQGFDSVRNVEAADRSPDRELRVRFSGRGDGAENMAEMLAYIGKIGGVGHSFEIVVDPDDSEMRKSFGFDGDGSDRILAIELDGKQVGAG